MSKFCPKCGSTHIRRGYTDPSLILRMIGIYNFLCNHCNLEYRKWALPGTAPERGRHKRSSSHRSRDGAKHEEKQSREKQSVETLEATSRHDAGLWEYVLFAGYYLKLLLKVSIGLHKTKHSLGLKYRWRNWQHWQKTGRA